MNLLWLFNSILINHPTTTKHTHRHLQTRTHNHSPPPHHPLRDTRLFFIIKEIALLCWLFYLKPWLVLCAPDHAVRETRRRAAGLIGAWDAQGGAAKLGGRRGKPLMGLSVCGSPLSPLSASLGLGCNALIGLLLIPATVTKSPAQNYNVICWRAISADGKSIVLLDFCNRVNADAIGLNTRNTQFAYWSMLKLVCDVKDLIPASAFCYLYYSHLFCKSPYEQWILRNLIAKKPRRGWTRNSWSLKLLYKIAFVFGALPLKVSPRV